MKAAVLAGVLFALAFGASVPLEAAPVRRPNIIVILSDDMGFSDVGCYGGEIRTPHLNQLASGGLCFSQYYNTARCCPTRASLLTGLYPHQAGVGHMMQDQGKDGYRGDLNRRCVTIAEVLRPAGYRNYAVGKWHVTRHTNPDSPKHNWPLQRGFDRYYGTIHGAGSFFDPSTLTRNNQALSAHADPDYQPKTYYYTDAISDHAVRFVADHQRVHKEKPFFLYVAYTAAHWPMHALPEDIARYKGKYDVGYEPIRKSRLENARKLGVLDRRWDLTPTVGDWDKVKDQRWEAAGMEVYAAMVDRMDQGIGKIVAELKRTGQLDYTLLFYLQDNGGCAEPMGRTPQKDHPNIARPEKPTLPPLKLDTLLPPGSVPPQTRDGYPVRMGPKVLPGPADTYVAYGRSWANVSNTPFREYKHWVHEGGISTPLIVHWPAGFKGKGEVRSRPGHLIDIMATCVEVSGSKYPTEYARQLITPLEGQSLVSAFDGKQERGPIYWEHEGNRAVRQGQWKLVSKHNQPWELYDLEADRTETKELAGKHPERVKELAGLYERWAKRCGVESWPVRTPRKASALTSPFQAIDLNVGEAQEVTLADGKKVAIKLLDLRETRDTLRKAVRLAEVTVTIDCQKVTLVSANYHLPLTVGRVQIDCPITKGYRGNATRDTGGLDPWGLDRDARRRVWPAVAPLLDPDTFSYPVKQRWFASATQMANEPVHVDGGENPLVKRIYYHYGLDMGGAEGLVEIVAATDGLVVSAGKEVLPGHEDTPVAPRYDDVYLQDGRGWYYRYSHLHTIAAAVRPGQRVKRVQLIGLLGKEGGSGGWSHLHFDISGLQPSGKWSIIEGYAFLWEAYVREHRPALLAVARPHHLAAGGEKVVLGGSRSWASGKIKEFQWTFTDGGTASGGKVERSYEKPGVYSEVLKIIDVRDRIDHDFGIVNVLDPKKPDLLPPSIHAVYYPTTRIKPGEPVTFLVRTFRTTDGKETWDFGDGSPKVRVQSDGNVKPLAKDGYARTVHRFRKAGLYTGARRADEPSGVDSRRTSSSPGRAGLTSQVRRGSDAHRRCRRAVLRRSLPRWPDVPRHRARRASGAAGRIAPRR